MLRVAKAVAAASGRSYLVLIEPLLRRSFRSTDCTRRDDETVALYLSLAAALGMIESQLSRCDWNWLVAHAAHH
jgi:hypothetical protein